MEAKLLSCGSISDEDFIDMEVSSFSTIFSGGSPPRNNREFEFKMETDLTTSPADELFYRGKLLPLHLPPRLQMVEKLLLQNSNYRSKDIDFEELYATPLTDTLTTPTAAATPYESCNISPFESRQASRELSAEEYLTEYHPGSFIKENYSKKTWTQKLKLIKQSSRAYLKSFFGKSGCSNESSAVKVVDEGPVSKKAGTKNVRIGQVQKERGGGLHRRSFSLAIRRSSVNKILSSSSSSVSSSSSSSSSSSLVSNNSNGSHRVQLLKRSGSVNSEMEKSIQGAIAHCKRSHQQPFCSRETVSEVGFYSSLSIISDAVCEGHERPEICRG